MKSEVSSQIEIQVLVPRSYLLILFVLVKKFLGLRFDLSGSLLPFEEQGPSLVERSIHQQTFIPHLILLSKNRRVDRFSLHSGLVVPFQKKRFFVIDRRRLSFFVISRGERATIARDHRFAL